MLVTRIAACWRNRERYVLRDLDGREITEAEGRNIYSERYKVPEEVRQPRRRGTKPKELKQRAGRGRKDWTKAAPASNPPVGALSLSPAIAWPGRLATRTRAHRNPLGHHGKR